MSETFIQALTAVLGKNLYLGDEIPERFQADWSGLEAVRPLALVRPRSTEEVSATLRLCNLHGVPVVAQGGMTGLAGGALPIAGGIAMSLDRMNIIEEIDPVMATVTVQAGTLLGNIQVAADAAGLYFGLDLGARDSCTIGGNLSTNAGGNRVIRYGMAREHVLGIEVVLADGTVVTSLNKMLKNNAGYDLKQYFIGSEGTLGIITRAVLRLQAKPAAISSAFCGCPDFGSILELLKMARTRMGSSLSAFEVMWPSFYDFMTGGLPELRRAFPESHGIYALIEASGADAQTELLHSVLAEALENGVITNAAIPASNQDALDLWAIRESVSEYGRLLGPLTAFDLGLPTSKIGEFVDAMEQGLRGRWPDVIVLSYGHIGDSNLHLVANVPSMGDTQPRYEITKLVYGAVGQFGGTISAEHGIGLLKKPYLSLSRSPAELEVMERIKRALDPNLILNTGKVLTIPDIR